MKTIHAQVPDPLYAQAAKFASNENMPLDNVISLALAQALGAWTAQSEITRRAARGNREKFLAVLDKVSESEPNEADVVP